MQLVALIRWNSNSWKSRQTACIFHNTIFTRLYYLCVIIPTFSESLEHSLSHQVWMWGRAGAPIAHVSSVELQICGNTDPVSVVFSYPYVSPLFVKTKTWERKARPSWFYRKKLKTVFLMDMLECVSLILIFLWSQLFSCFYEYQEN